MGIKKVGNILAAENELEKILYNEETTEVEKAFILKILKLLQDLKE